MKFVTKNDFVTPSEIEEILSYVPPQLGEITNEHIRAVNEASKGWSVLADLTKTDISSEVARFQGDATLIEDVPVIYREIASRIASTVGISADHVFFQYISVGANGKVQKHYDAGKPGYITYKCNICVSGPDSDVIHVHGNDMPIKPADLYCFEANLYKHWMDSHPAPRIHLSYGFLLPYADLGWSEDHPRVRLSNKIWKHYIGKS